MTTLNSDIIDLEDSDAAHDFLQPRLDDFHGERARGHCYKDTHINGQGNVHLGDQHIQQQFLTLQIGSKDESSANPTSAYHPSRVYEQPLGLCLDQAPYLSSELFIGRENDIEKMHELLKPLKRNKEQRRVVLGGIGGVGKTQLALAYAKHYCDEYESILWMNSASDATMNTSLQSICERIFAIEEVRTLSNDQLNSRVKRWLSDSKNSQWLLIFDNYDDPENFDIQNYLPYTSHGAVIFTTRLPGKVSGSHFTVRPLTELEISLQILETRSRRQNVKDDIHAHRLAAKLAGLPLALATAGAYLYTSAWSFERYLQDYDSMWTTQSRQSVQLTDYQGTLYTTWDLSYKRLKIKSPQAAELLKMLAYFDHQAVWYDLLKSGKNENVPEELKSIVDDGVQFDSVMNTLASYCFVEVQPMVGVYGMHACVHDWALECLNTDINLQSYCFAVSCIMKSTACDGVQELAALNFAQFVPHALRLTHSRFTDNIDQATESHPLEMLKLGHLLWQQLQHPLNESILQSIRATSERRLRNEHRETLSVIRSLGLLYQQQQRWTEAEQIFKCEFTAREKICGPDDPLTHEALGNLGLIYDLQERLEEAERTFEQVSASFERLLGPDDIQTLLSYHHLGHLYCVQAKVGKAETMLVKALAGCEKVLGSEHLRTLATVHTLGYLRWRQGSLKEAEALCLWAMAGREKHLGREHPETIKCVVLLGCVYRDQGKVEPAEQMFERSFTTRKKLWGSEHDKTKESGRFLARLYQSQVRVGEAQMIFEEIQENLPKQFNIRTAVEAKTDPSRRLGLTRLKQKLSAWKG